MTKAYPFAPPQAQQGTAQASAEPDTDFSRAFAADDPPYDVYDVTDVFGPGRRPIPKIAIQQPRVKDQGHAIAAAHKTLEDCADAVKSDPDALDNEKQVEILYRACRSAENPKHDAFPGPKWMRANFTTEQLGALMGLLALTRRKYGPGGLKSFEPGEVDMYARGIHAAAPADAYSKLATMPHADLAGLCMVLASHYVAHTGEIEALRLALPDETDKPEEG